MRIEVKGRGLPVTDELREQVARRFEKVSRQVADVAVLEVELSEQHLPGTSEQALAEATLHLKGTSLRASNAGRDHRHALNLVAEELSRQVKRHRDKRRKRRESRAAAATPPGAPAPAGEASDGPLPAV